MKYSDEQLNKRCVRSLRVERSLADKRLNINMCDYSAGVMLLRVKRLKSEQLTPSKWNIIILRGRKIFFLLFRTYSQIRIECPAYDQILDRKLYKMNSEWRCCSWRHTHVSVLDIVMLPFLCYSLSFLVSFFVHFYCVQISRFHENMPVVHAYLVLNK